jgi:hypothetical protein
MYNSMQLGELISNITLVCSKMSLYFRNKGFWGASCFFEKPLVLFLLTTTIQRYRQ